LFWTVSECWLKQIVKIFVICHIHLLLFFFILFYSSLFSFILFTLQRYDIYSDWR